MAFSLQNLSPAFHRARAQGELIGHINHALDTGRADVAAFGVRQLILRHGTSSQTGAAITAMIDRVERGIAAQPHHEGQYADALSRQYDRALASQKKWEQTTMGRIMTGGRAPSENRAPPLEKMIAAAADGVRTLVELNLRDRKIVPAVGTVLNRIARSDALTALDLADFIAQTASPKWFGLAIGEDAALTGRHKVFGPLKTVALTELLRISNQAEARNNLKLAFHAAAQAEFSSANARIFSDLHSAAQQKRIALQQKGNFPDPYYRPIP